MLDNMYGGSSMLVQLSGGQSASGQNNHTPKIVALAISVEYLIFTIFFDVSQLCYKPSSFAGANMPYAVG